MEKITKIEFLRKIQTKELALGACFWKHTIEEVYEDLKEYAKVSIPKRDMGYREVTLTSYGFKRGTSRMELVGRGCSCYYINDRLLAVVSEYETAVNCVIYVLK